jgi:hypothetical protein
MLYNSVTEYFSRLQNRSWIFFLTNVLLFSVLLYLMMVKILTPVMPDEAGLLVAVGICFFALAEAFASGFLTTVMFKKVRLIESLGDRLDKYANISLIRFGMLLSGSLLLMVAFYLSGELWILVAYAIHLLFTVVAWPTRSRVCAELKLRPSEAEVIYGR